MKYTKMGFQEEYERHLHGIWEATKVWLLLLLLLTLLLSFKTAEMRALKMEVQRQMQIHGDYKVISPATFYFKYFPSSRRGTTGRTLPTMSGNRELATSRISTSR